MLEGCRDRTDVRTERMWRSERLLRCVWVNGSNGSVDNCLEVIVDVQKIVFRKVGWISGSSCCDVVAYPLFRVDVPSSSLCVRFHRQGGRNGDR
jgi:hypothetical protein